MRTRIARDAAGAPATSVRTTKQPFHLPRRAIGPALLAAALLAAVVLATTMAGAANRSHRAETRHLAGATGPAGHPPRSSLVAAYGRAAVGLRWLASWKAAHPPPPPAPAPVLTDATSTTTADWACIRVHESGDRFNSPTAPGGAYGFLEMTWLSLGYSGWPYEAAPAVQSEAALFLYNELGWQPWSTRIVCGL
jgi:Transglycosylase-like domain